MLPRSIFNIPGYGSTNPLVEMEQLRRQMDALSGMFFREMPVRRVLSAGVFPQLNLTENKDNYYVRAELPGMKADELSIQIVDKTLTISGERKILNEGEKVRYHRRERDAGKFSRAIGLPGDINNDRIEAQMRDGLLTITIPKAEAAKPRQITIN
jgi:HSP20 family protein